MALRILHSIFRATVHLVPIRFALFSLSWVALAIMIVREAMAIS